MKPPLRAVAAILLAPLSCAYLNAAANELASAESNLVRAQADSPVNWMRWGEPAFARAQQEQKPLFVTVGVFTSELTRAMARQSFSNADAAALLNESFVCVYVDAKEQPDVAALYQNYLQAVKQLSGPPMNLWLTPDLKPFEGANYLPPTEEWGKEGFITANKRVASAWKADPAAQRRKADEAVATVVSMQPEPAAAAPAPADLTQLMTDAVQLWRDRFDAAHGGFGESPKYAEPELLRFLLRTEDTRDLATKTLDVLLASAVRDPLDDGFYRYAVDPEWKQPYFQKLLVDQPRIALALLDAARVTGHARYGAVARDALHFALQQLALPQGDFAAAEDATTEAATAAYTWSVDELQSVLGKTDAAEFARLHGVVDAGNIAEDAFPGVTTKGRNILHRAVALPADGPESAVVASARKLLEERRRRITAERDDGSTSGAHGLMLTALARAGAELKDEGLARAAQEQFAFIRDQLRTKDGALRRLAGRDHAAAPADYAHVIEGLLTHARTAGEADAQQLALELLRTVTSRFWDSKTGRYFVVPADASGFWARVHAPAPGSGEPPTAEPAMLLALQGAELGDPLVTETIAKLTAAVAADVKLAPEAPRGDLLLALSASSSAHRP